MTSERTETTICHISTVHPPSDVRILYRECRSLADAGYSVHLVVQASREEVIDGVRVHPLTPVRNRLVRMLLSPWRALREALRTGADIYHYHDPELMGIGFVLRWLLGKNVVYDVHESVPRQVMGKRYLPPILRPLIAWIYRVMEPVLTRGQRFVVANENCLNDYPRERSYLVRNYPVVTDKVSALVESADRSTEKPLLVYVGSINEGRGAFVYLELAAALAERGRDFEMRIVGQCAPRLRQAMQERIVATGLDGCVRLHGRTEWYEAMELASKASIGMCLLLPSPNYTTCLATKIVEYAMLGTPVLASRFECWREFVEGERVGMMADPTRLEEVVAVCETMLNDPAGLALMGQRGKAAVAKTYNWSAEFPELLRCYDELIGIRTTPAPPR